MILLDAYLTAASLIIGVLAFGNSFFIFRNFKTRVALALAAFWALAGCVWFFIGLSVLFWLLEQVLWARVFAYAVFVAVILEGPFLLYHLITKIGKESAAKIMFWVYVLGSGVYMYFLFIDKIPEFFVTEWGVVEFIEPASAHLIINLLYIPPAILVVFDFVKRCLYWLKNRRLESFSYFFSTLSLLLYMAGGFIDLPGLTGNMLLVTKLIVMLSVLVCFLGFYFDPAFQMKKESWDI